MCDTTTFTANVSGVGYLITPDGWTVGPYLQSLLMNITTDHPQTLQVSLTSPAGTTLLLTAFNGAGGQNYTNTSFEYYAWNNITAGSAPFNGSFLPQGGSFDVFSGQNANGAWVITVIDTSCANGGTGPGGNWTPGWFDGSGTGTFAFGFDSGQVTTDDNDMGTQIGVLCPGGSVDVMSYFQTSYPFVTFTAYDQGSGNMVVNPDAVTQAGIYSIEYLEMGSFGGYVYYHGIFTVTDGASVDLGPDQVVDQCGTGTPVALSGLFDLTGLDATWTLDGVPIMPAEADNATIGGVYEVMVGANSGCPSSATATLNIHPTPVLGPDETVTICDGGTADLTALYTTAGLQTAWTFAGGAGNDPAAVEDAGTYTLVVTSQEGCTATAHVTLVVNAPASLGADQAVAICSNDDLDLTSLFATAGMTQEWTNSGTPVPTPTAVNAAGTYQLVASSTGACSDTALVVVSLNAAPALGADANAALCSGGSLDLTALFSTTGLSTEWNLNGTVVAAPDAVDAAGLYTLVATNADGCSDEATVLVAVSPSPELGPDQNITRCAGESVDLFALYPPGTGTAMWSLNGAGIAHPNAVNVSGSYSVIITTAAGCTDDATVVLQFNPTPVLGDDQAVSICAGDSYDLTALYNTAGLSAVWSYANAPVNDPTAVQVAGNYKLVATNTLNCSDVAVVNVGVSTPPSLGPDQVFSICPWLHVDLTTAFPVIGTNVTYILNGEAVLDPTNVTEAGSYMITSVAVSGCSDQAMATVVPVECLCEADFVEDARCLQEPVQFTLVADSAVIAAHWDFHGAASNSSWQDPSVRFNAAGQMQVTLHATLSCGEVTVERMVTVPDCSDSCSLFIPTAYTPDGDGVNDGWIWHGECKPEDYSMYVFDRWGGVVFSSTDPYKAWDGTANGKELPVGVYAYRVAYRLLYQDAKEEMGTITLVR